MNNILKNVFDYVFSFAGFMTAFGLGIGFLLVSAVQSENQHRAEEKAYAAACYSINAVPVDTDAGKRCAAPNALVEIKQ
jgi:hypothetical protein